MSVRRSRARRRTGAVAVVAALGLSLAACGGSDGAASGRSPSAAASSPDGVGPSFSPSPSPTPSGLTGMWPADPGQADRIQQKLTAAGFECTRSAEPSADLRVCSKGRKLPENRVAQAALRFVADPQGTVLIASMEQFGKVGDLEKVMAEALLPAADAAVLLADGTNLGWGLVVPDVSNPRSKYLTVKAWTPEASFVPTAKPLPTTKEKALPALQAAGLQCKFSTRDEWGTPRNGLECKDPTFKTKEEDGSIVGPTAELVLIDNGTGVEGIRVEGSHSRIVAENARGVRLMMPRATAVDSDQGLRDAGAWVLSRLDGLPHSAYVGQWRVEIDVAPEGGLTSWPLVRARLSIDKPNLGFKMPS